MPSDDAHPVPASGGAARRWFAIINPASGAMRSRAFREFWVPEIKRRAVTVFSEGPQHATQLASEARDYHGIVAVGGDGTALEVLAGIDRQNQCFAVLPAGRGNSLARDLGVASMERGTEALGSGRARRIDLIELKLTHVDQTTTRALAASTVAVGYAVAVAQRAGDFAATGRQAYTVATAFVRPVNVDISIGYGEKDATPCDRTGVLISNTRHVANFVAFPEASPCDGALDIMELKAGWLRQSLHNLSVLARSSLIQPYRRARATSVRVILRTPMPVLVDGEIYDRVAAFSSTCMPGGALCQTPVAA